MKREKMIGIRVHETEKAEILDMAKSAGMEPSEFIRAKLLGKEGEQFAGEIDPRPRISKCESDILDFVVNNAMLLRYLIDKLGNRGFLKEAEEWSKNWKEKNYRTD